MEDDHYRQLVTSGTRVHISCVDGQLIEDARVKDFGTYALLVESDAGEELVWKHAIVTIYPSEETTLGSIEEGKLVEGHGQTTQEG